MRRRRKRERSVSLKSFTDRSARRSVLQYTMNILDCIKPDMSITILAMDCLTLSARKKVIMGLMKYEKETGKDPDSVMSTTDILLDELDNAESLSDLIMKLLVRRINSGMLNSLKHLLLEELQAALQTAGTGESAFDRRMKGLASIFTLSADETAVLKLAYLAFACRNYTLGNVFSGMDYDEFLKTAQIATGMASARIRKSLSRTGILVSSGIIEYIDPAAHRIISLDDSITEYLAGVSPETVTEKFVRPDRGRKLGLSSFSVPEEDTAIIRDLLSSGRPCNILLYGIPGTGKTEYARSIASICPGSVYMLRHGESDSGSGRRRYSSADSRLIALKVAMNTAAENGGILIADEADFLLNTGRHTVNNGAPEKGWLNDLLDCSGSRVIWITNTTGAMEESTLRRFSYSVCFKRFGKEQRMAVWNNVLRRSPVKKYISPELMADLSSRFEVNAGGIASSVESLGRIAASRKLDPCEVRLLMENILSRHAGLTGMASAKKTRLNTLTDKYDLSFLNTDADPACVVKSVKRLVSGPGRGADGAGLNLLLWGLPGTGKTEFAKYLASETGRRLTVKRASDLMNMYSGETEKLIRDAFREAAENESILLVDEADTFLVSRERARASWEVSFINEFLVQMENFDGILVCCTNMPSLFDSAAMRRFGWKICFSPLLQEKRVPLYKRYFCTGGMNLTTAQEERIRSIENLTPGHAKALHRRLSLMEIMPCHDEMITGLEKEATFMSARTPATPGFRMSSRSKLKYLYNLFFD